jgi:hypothetical protein
MADVLISCIFEIPVFTCGKTLGMTDVVIRKTYINALQDADKGRYQRLIEFARS